MDREQRKGMTLLFILLTGMFMLGLHAGKAIASEPYQEGYERGYCHGKGVDCLPPIQAPERPPNPNEGVDPQSIYDRGFYDGSIDAPDQENPHDLGEPATEEKPEWEW